MDHAIYTAMGAASQTLNQQAVTASNLANASTPGFRAQLNALRAVPGVRDAVAVVVGDRAVQLVAAVTGDVDGAAVARIGALAG